MLRYALLLITPGTKLRVTALHNAHIQCGTTQMKYSHRLRTPLTALNKAAVLSKIQAVCVYQTDRHTVEKH